MSIEIFRKGFRLDVDPAQVVTFKKSQNLNGIQDRYAYSNTITLDDTANNRKLLELFYLPANKLTSLMNGYTVDVVLNRSISLRNQTLKIQKENKKNFSAYLLYTDNALVVTLKDTYINEVAKEYTYKKTVADLVANNALTETQPDSGLYVIEEMPLLINVQELMAKVFTDNNFTVYGDFFKSGSAFSEFYLAPNKGTYQIYSGTGDGFAPTFDENLDAYSLLTQVLAYFNCYAEIDDTYRTVVMNRWTNLENYKESFVDYSKHYSDYKEYAFQSKLAKKNELKYADSGTSYDSFFNNNLSSQKSSVYLSSDFGTGTLNIFENATVDDSGEIPVREDGLIGETSAVRLFKISADPVSVDVFVGGVAQNVSAWQALPVSMQTVFTEFHKDYTDFILTPLIGIVEFKYNDILAADFSMTRTFFIEQLSSYWVPLEINYSTKKEKIQVKSMLVKKRKVESPTLDNLNSVYLDFKEKATLPLATFLAMYPMPPNSYAWDVVIFSSYDEDLNSLYVNDVLIPANTLPQAFNIADLTSIKIEANKASDTQPDTNSSSIYLQAIDTNGGESNVAYINVVHTGVARLESNFEQTELFSYSRHDFDRGVILVSPNVWYQGPRPNLNNTVQHTANVWRDAPFGDEFNLVVTGEPYTNVKVDISAFQIYLKTRNRGIGKARASARLRVTDGITYEDLIEVNSANNAEHTFAIPALSYTWANLPTGRKLWAAVRFSFDNRRGSNSGSMDVDTTISGFKVKITTTKTT